MSFSATSFRNICRALAPLAAVALAGAVAGCDAAKISINGEEGKRLSDLDLAGQAPTEIAMLGPDRVEVSEGGALAIAVEGDPSITDHLRFTLKDGTLGILRAGRTDGDGTATVKVTMPALREVSMLGSGTIEAAALAPEAKVAILGSGTIATPTVKATALNVDLAGSGRYSAGGSATNLKLNVAGSGEAAMEALRVDKASVSIAGSGDARFASDGEVAAKILGSGEVTVIGRARCTVDALGSGKLNCQPAG